MITAEDTNLLLFKPIEAVTKEGQQLVMPRASPRRRRFGPLENARYIAQDIMLQNYRPLHLNTNEHHVDTKFLPEFHMNHEFYLTIKEITPWKEASDRRVYKYLVKHYFYKNGFRTKDVKSQGNQIAKIIQQHKYDLQLLESYIEE